MHHAVHVLDLRVEGAFGRHVGRTHAVQNLQVIEIAEWDSAEARDAVMQSDAMAAYAPVFEMLAAPFSATVVTALP